LEAQDRTVDVRDAEHHARVVDEITRREVVGAVNDDIVLAQDLERVLARETYIVCDDACVRIERTQPFRRDLDLAPADIARVVEDLALEIAQVDDVVIDNAD